MALRSRSQTRPGIAVVVAGHLEVEDGGLVAIGVVVHQDVLEQVQNVLADVLELGRLDLGLVDREQLLIFWSPARS